MVNTQGGNFQRWVLPVTAEWESSREATGLTARQVGVSGGEELILKSLSELAVLWLILTEGVSP